MNKRQMKKRDKKLVIAIRKLNEDVAKDFDIESPDEKELLESFHRVKANPESVQKTFRDYKKYILKR